MLVLGVIAGSGTVIYNNNKDSKAVSTVKLTEPIKKQNATNADSIKDEKNQDSLIITELNAQEVANSESSINKTVKPKTTTPTPTAIPQPSYDDYGPSTKIGRPDVHTVAGNVGSIYRQYLFALQSVSEDQRQATSNAFVIENKAKFSDTFYNDNFENTSNLSLLLQSSGVKLPTEIKVYSAIVDPEDPTKVIVQITMEPDVPWSLLVSAKKSDYLGNFGYIDKIYIRQNLYPL